MSPSAGKDPGKERPRRRPKLKRGGQPGNSNSVKHGFYSKRLTPAEEREFKTYIEMENLDPGLAFIKVKVRNLLENDPANTSALNKAAGLITRYCIVRYSFDSFTARVIRTMFEQLLADSAADMIYKKRSGNP